MTNIIIRVPTTELLKKTACHDLMPVQYIQSLNIFISSAIWVYGEAFFKNESQFSYPNIAILTIVTNIGVTTLVSILGGISALIYSEGRLASESIQTNLPIGYIVQCRDEDDINHIYQLRDMPSFNVQSVCPIVIRQTRGQLIDQLQISNDSPILVRDYTLEDVTDTKKLGVIIGAYHSLYLALATLVLVEFKNSYASTALFFATVLISFPVNAFFLSKLFKASTSLYSHIPGTQFKGCFFSRPAEDFRQIETDELHAPLLINGEF